MNSLQLMGGVIEGGLKTVEEAKIASAIKFSDALSLCIQLSVVKRTDTNLAVCADIHPAQFSRIRQGKAHLPGDKIALIERLCGNTALTQWLAYQNGLVLKVETPEEKIIRLQKRIAELEAA